MKAMDIMGSIEINVGAQQTIAWIEQAIAQSKTNEGRENLRAIVLFVLNDAPIDTLVAVAQKLIQERREYFVKHGV